MDRQSDLKVRDFSSATRVFADQAIFTSIRTLMGEGYRIVAASAGLGVDEKMEIVRHSPSHGSLCDPSPAGTGLSSYRLTSGRHCVAHSHCAGQEHTARGGQRVYTTVAVLDQQAYRCFQYNPVRVWKVLSNSVTDLTLSSLPAALDELSLALDERQPSTSCTDAAESINAECLGHALSVLLADEPLVIIGAENAMEMLQWVLLALPVSIRQSISATAGLKFSPSRRSKLVLIDRRDAEKTQLALKRYGIRWLDAQAPPQQSVGRSERWVRLIQRLWRQGRRDEIVKLTERLSFDVQPAQLDRIAAACEDLDLSDEDALAALAEGFPEPSLP